MSLIMFTDSPNYLHFLHKLRKAIKSLIELSTITLLKIIFLISTNELTSEEWDFFKKQTQYTNYNEVPSYKLYHAKYSRNMAAANIMKHRKYNWHSTNKLRDSAPPVCTQVALSSSGLYSIRFISVCCSYEWPLAIYHHVCLDQTG